MTKRQLATAIQRRVEAKHALFLSGTALVNILNALVDEIRETVEAGEKVSLQGLGTFDLKVLKAVERKNHLANIPLDTIKVGERKKIRLVGARL